MTIQEVHARVVCRSANVRFVGIQKSPEPLPDLILFQTNYRVLARTTLAVAVGSDDVDIYYRILRALRERRQP